MSILLHKRTRCISISTNTHLLLALLPSESVFSTVMHRYPGRMISNMCGSSTSQVAFKVLSACSSVTQGLLFGSEGAMEL